MTKPPSTYLHQCQIVLLVQLQLALELRKVDVLRVPLLLLLALGHEPSLHVAHAFVNRLSQHLHYPLGLILRHPVLLEPLDKQLRVEVRDCDGS